MQSYDLSGSTDASEQEDEGGGDMSAAILEGKAKELMAEQGYLDGTMKDTNPAKYERIHREITGLFDKVEKRQVQEAVVDAEQAESQEQARSEAERAVLIEQAKEEMLLLNQLGFDSDIPDDITAGDVTVLKMERLVRQGNYDEFLPLIQSEGLRLGGTPYPQQVIDAFLSMDDASRLEHALVEIRKVLQAGRKQCLGETE
jgi:hypothetical protein